MIQFNKEYTISEIVKLNLIPYTKRDTSKPGTQYQKEMVMRYIRQGKLKATNIAIEPRKIYRILGADIAEFLRNYDKRIYITK